MREVQLKGMLLILMLHGHNKNQEAARESPLRATSTAASTLDVSTTKGRASLHPPCLGVSAPPIATAN
jgi:hypothetical protein